MTFFTYYEVKYTQIMKSTPFKKKIWCVVIHDDKNMVQPVYYSPVLYGKTDENHVLFSFLYILQCMHHSLVFWITFVLQKRFLQDHFWINPALKSENPASCLCTIALFRCVRPAPLSTLRGEVRCATARFGKRMGRKWNIT